MFFTKEDIQSVKFPVLHDCLYLINRIYPQFKSCYMDGKGELALKFDGILSDEAIKDVLFQLSAIEDTPYSPAPIGPSAMTLKYGRTHSFSDDNTYTQVFSKDGWDYRRMD